MIVKDQEGTVNERTNEHIVIDNKQFNIISFTKEYLPEDIINKKVLYGYDDQTMQLKFLKIINNKEEDPLIQIATHLKHMNWNLGRIVAYLENDNTLKEQIIDDMNESQHSRKEQ